MLSSLLEGTITQDEYTAMNNINVKLVKLPSYVYGLIYKHKDEFLVAINKNLSYKKIKETLLHEFAHFELHHCDKELYEFKLENVEDEADKYVDFLLGK